MLFLHVYNSISFRFQVPSSKFKVPSSKFQVSGFKFQVSTECVRI